MKTRKSRAARSITRHGRNKAGTKIMLMGVERIGQIASALMRHGATPATPVALVRWGTTGRQQTVCGCLNDIAQVVAEQSFTAPAVAVFGDVVHLRDR